MSAFITDPVLRSFSTSVHSPAPVTCQSASSTERAHRRLCAELLTSRRSHTLGRGLDVTVLQAAPSGAAHLGCCASISRSEDPCTSVRRPIYQAVSVLGAAVAAFLCRRGGSVAEVQAAIAALEEARWGLGFREVGRLPSAEQHAYVAALVGVTAT